MRIIGGMSDDGQRSIRDQPRRAAVRRALQAALADGAAAPVLNWSVDTIPDPSQPSLSSPDLAWVGGSNGKLFSLNLAAAVPAPLDRENDAGDLG